MKAKLNKNNLYRESFAKQELNSKIDKFIQVNLLCTTAIDGKSPLVFYLNDKSQNNQKACGSKSKLKNVCVMTSTTKSVNKKYSIGRIKLREMFSFGVVPGFKKSVW